MVVTLLLRGNSGAVVNLRLAQCRAVEGSPTRAFTDIRTYSTTPIGLTVNRSIIPGVPDVADSEVYHVAIGVLPLVG